MPNGQSKIVFNAVYLKSIEVYITNCRTLYNRLSPKIKYLHLNNLSNAISTLQSIKDYAAFNGVQIPRLPYGKITHNQYGHRFLAKGALAIKQLRNAAPASVSGLATKALDCIVVFENQLP